jgi:hypothetical protein
MSSGQSSPPKNGSPLWLDAVRRLERAIGTPIERLVTSETYFDVLPHLRRAQAQLQDTVAALTDEWYRLLNVPTGSDQRQMREQLSRMERQIEKLTKQLADSEKAAAAAAAKPRAAARKRDETG